MRRSSRIVRKPGSRYLSIFARDVERFGLAAAAVIALLDFFDRCEDVSGLPTATRERIIADLQGVVGKHTIDTAITTLLTLGVVQKNEKVSKEERNYVRSVKYSLDASALSILLGAPETGSKTGGSLYYYCIK